MKNLRNLTWQFPLLFFLATPLWYDPVASFLNPKAGESIAVRKKKAETYDFSMDGVYLLESKNGKITTKIKAEEAYTGDIKTNYIMKQVDAELYLDSGEKVNIISDKGVFYSEKKQLTLIDNVIVSKPKDNQRLYSDLLHYFDETRVVQCPGNTRLVSDNVEVKGSSLHYNMETEAYEVTGRVFCTVKLDEENGA